ncbi:urocortin [Dendropsophus ebraccatus]|uniref:urocortin n=1 Tax=Dendropsophus ebraccatus TaxID=150705 RepID=UPI0038314C5E
MSSHCLALVSPPDFADVIRTEIKEAATEEAGKTPGQLQLCQVTMKAASSSSITLLACLLILTGQAGAHPLERSFFEGPRLSLEGLLSDESAQALLYFIREKVPQLEVGDPHVQLRLSKGSLSAEQKMSPQDLAPVLSVLQTVFQESRPEESARTFLEVFSDRLKREDPPISIDLTYHILRHMIDMAKTQNQKHQAEQNRIIFDSVGK